MKKRLLAGMIAVMTLSGISASIAESNSEEVNASFDSRIIVECNKSLDGLSYEEILSSQNNVVKAIKSKVTSNIKVVGHYSVLNNAFVAEVNSSDIEAIRALNEVASVTLDEIHAKKDISDGSYYTANFIRPAEVEGEDTGAEVKNISAETMNKPDGTNEGEGTVIAILDNEFYLRAEHEESWEIPQVKPEFTFETLEIAKLVNHEEWPDLGIVKIASSGVSDQEALYFNFTREKDGSMSFKPKAIHDDGSAWSHAVFKDLEEGDAKKFTYSNLTSILAGEGFHGKRAKNAVQGKEGSCWFNDKVPFYYDYGGESTDYGKVGKDDYDVSSTLTYHGSHVASIAAANADTYKGIAPKAQLACMKVFTTFEPTDTGEQMGFGTSTGAYDSAILYAVEDAIKLGVDGINMSLGSDLDDFDTESITMKTLADLANKSGILSAISAGNAGKSSYSFTGGYGNWTTDMVETGVLGSYANSTDNMIVASGQPSEIYYENAFKLLNADGSVAKNVAYEDQIVNREGMDADYAENAQRWMTDLVKDLPEEQQSTTEIEWQYIPGFGTAEDYDKLNVENKVVVVNRGSTSFAEKYNIAANKGACAIVIVNNDPTATDFNFRCSFGDDFQSKIPCALALYKDKPTFESLKSGKFVFIKKAVSHNDLEKTISSYSSDGARFDYSLKPDITTPGENIRGAVPPQKKEHREETPYSTYEYLSGTSMAAPNYAGAQALMTSKVSKEVYSREKPALNEKERALNYRKTVDLRLMSTANAMFDGSVNPENPEVPAAGVLGSGSEKGISYTSPRMQGAGLVDLEKAYNTKIYFDGLDEEGNRINKSKIQLKNNKDIASGKLDLKFKAINEGDADTFTAKVTVMRPAIVNSNKVVSGDYNYRGEYDKLENIPGLQYVENDYIGHTTVLSTNSANDYEVNDVIKVTKQLDYYTEVQPGKETISQYEGDPEVLKQSYYYCQSINNGLIKWVELPGYDYQSVQDVVIDTFTREVTIPAGENDIEIKDYELSKTVKDDIMSKFPYGCPIEGYVEFYKNEEKQLSIPYLGFFSNYDEQHKDNILTNAPVVEPFSFEKDKSVIYPSELVEDVTKQLVGKDNVDFGSAWYAGYAETTMDIDTEQVLTNEANLSSFKGFHEVGVDPKTNKYFTNPGEHIYVGSPDKTNTMLIQQYVMRSVKDNYFIIRNANGEQVYKSVLKDMLFGGNSLYKSHVDANYLSAGYVAHRAFAIIPLYDINTRKAFESGEYTLEFNYQLAYDENWVSKSYNFVIDSKTPEITDITEYEKDGEKRVRIDIDESIVSKCTIGYSSFNVQYDTEKKDYYIDVTKEYLEGVIDSINELSPASNGQKRLFISITDSAWGVTTAIIHFFGNTFSNYVIAQGNGFAFNTDFIKDGKNVTFFTIDEGDEIDYVPTEYITIKTSFGEEFHVEVPKEETSEKSGGCGGSILGGTLIATGAALAGAALVSLKKRKDDKEEK